MNSTDVNGTFGLIICVFTFGKGSKNFPNFNTTDKTNNAENTEANCVRPPTESCTNVLLSDIELGIQWKQLENIFVKP